MLDEIRRPALQASRSTPVDAEQAARSLRAPFGRWGIRGLLLAAVLGGCTDGAPSPGAPPSTRAATPSAIRVAVRLSDSTGTHVTVQGLAEDIDGHAGLRLDRPGARLVLAGVSAWPGELHGAPVTVQGRLDYDDSLASRELGLSGLVLSDATWTADSSKEDRIIAGTQLAAARGTHATIEGLASDAHASATVVLFGQVVFLPELVAWDRATRGRAVRVEGRLTSRPFSEDPCPYPGTVTRALWGRRWTLTDMTWTLAE